MLGYAFCGSFCTLSHALASLRRLIGDGYDVQPILSERVYTTDTRFWQHDEFRERVENLCQKKAIFTLVDAEPLGPANPLDALIIAPCTGNTLAKIANGITDSAVTMAAKAHLRSDRPLILALASNDSMSTNLANIASLLLRKQVYFVPMRQDDPDRKPHSLVADFTQVSDTLTAAKEGRQVRPIFL